MNNLSPNVNTAYVNNPPAIQTSELIETAPPDTWIGDNVDSPLVKKVTTAPAPFVKDIYPTSQLPPHREIPDSIFFKSGK